MVQCPEEIHFPFQPKKYKVVENLIEDNGTVKALYRELAKSTSILVNGGRWILKRFFHPPI
jgi:hypothetical protein